MMSRNNDKRPDLKDTIFRIVGTEIIRVMAPEDVPTDIPAFVPLIREEPSLGYPDYCPRPAKRAVGRTGEEG